MTAQLPLLVYMLDQSACAEHFVFLEQLLPTVQLSYRLMIVTPGSDVPDALHYLSTAYPTVEVIALTIPAQASWLTRIRTLVAFFRELPASCSIHILAYTLTSQSDTLIALKIANLTHILLSLDVVIALSSNAIVSRIIHRYLLTIPAHIMVASHDTKQALISQYQLLATRASVVPIGIDDQAFVLHLVTAQPRSTYRIPNNGFLVTAYAPFEEAYGLDVLIRAMHSVWQYHPATQLLLAGDGSQATTLHTLAAHTAQPDHIHFVPPPADLAAFWAGVDIVVYPARHSAMPMTVLVAMALERPVIGCNIPNIHDIIETNGNGLLTRPNDPEALASAISRLIHDHTLRIAISFNARTRVSQRFRKDVWLNALGKCYRMI